MKQSPYAVAMRKAIELAGQSRFDLYPNPCVGAVLVAENGAIVAEGWHKECGKEHAEIHCLNNAKENGVDAAKCTLVVTLEPCNHHGKTGPCTEAIVKAGIKHVVIGTKDPTSLAGGGGEYLKSHGVKVEMGVEEKLCQDLIADFLCWQGKAQRQGQGQEQGKVQEQGRPYVLLKLASTLDGRIATRTGHSQWVSGEDSRRRVQILRQKLAQAGGAIVIGGSTFREDNPRLTVRYPDGEDGPQPLACIVTSRMPTINFDHTILHDRPQDVIFYSSPAGAASPTAKALTELGAKVWSQPLTDPKMRMPSLDALFKRLFSEMNCPYILCEGGGKLALSLLEQGLVDEFHLHLAPRILGDNEARPLFDGKSPLDMSEALSLRIADYEMHGEDMHLMLRPK